MDRSQKAESVAALNAVFNEVGLVVVTRNLGLSVAQSTALRGKMRDAGASYKVSKNRLAKLALKDTQYEGLEEYLTGPIALAWSTDPIAAAKAAVEFAKTNDKLVIRAGAMPNQVMTAKEVATLASMPSRNELLAKLMGTMQAPIAKLAQTLNEVPGKFVRTLAAVRDAKEKQTA